MIEKRTVIHLRSITSFSDTRAVLLQRTIMPKKWNKTLFEPGTFPQPGKTPEAWDEEEWDRIVAQPQVQRGFNRLADKIRSQVATGKFEEGGFSVE